MERAVKTERVFSPNKDLETWPPSSIAAGNKFSIVTSMPTHPAKATGCNET
jgi:hypothetical protein